VTRSLRKRFALLSALLFAVGCASARPQVLTFGCPDPKADVVFVADGSGDYRTASLSLGQAVNATAAPLRVETFVWSHGYGKMYEDHVDHDNHIYEGRRLACLVMSFKRRCPERAVYLVGHSSGAAVILAAAQAVPPDTIERIVLLAPAVSSEYDLRPSLRSCRCGLDVFTSRRDVGALAIATGVVGTADRRRTSAAGRVGFTPILAYPEDQQLYTKLRIHPWTRSLAWSGNRGSHYGTLGQQFMRSYILPLLSRSQ
jgi:hypothetical protein